MPVACHGRIKVANPDLQVAAVVSDTDAARRGIREQVVHLLRSGLPVGHRLFVSVARRAPISPALRLGRRRGERGVMSWREGKQRPSLTGLDAVSATGSPYLPGAALCSERQPLSHSPIYCRRWSSANHNRRSQPERGHLISRASPSAASRHPTGSGRGCASASRLKHERRGTPRGTATAVTPLWQSCGVFRTGPSKWSDRTARSADRA